MAPRSAKSDEGWSGGLQKFAEAARQQATAVQLTIAGAVVLGAAATTYLLDQERREQVLGATRDWVDQLTGFWQSWGRQESQRR